MKSGSVVGSTVESAMSDTRGNLLDGQTIVRYGSAAQGNAQSARGTNKLHNRTVSNRAVGGTSNDIKAMFGLDGAKLCKVVKRDLDTHMWQGGVMVRTNTKPSVTHTVTVQCDTIPTSTLLRRAELKDMGVLAYCQMLGYTPGNEQLADLLSFE